ncbi:hypothetical protein XBP1_2630010 [Xenorhabdus bovienii str. puntauvense]|uniref:Carrier domain-containing protein n=2 Tax=Xenorhabdus bovienii TaxID=40576 RepID=A0A077NHP3_XENBV|nr:hypothetical protein XBP1_2630010 [Xenorhabdus bovienii str. puntauvense]CDH00813.1 hypothetical protein XBFM1_1900007 [Xenorhabdus bovienii str. feltiae Moldova]
MPVNYNIVALSPLQEGMLYHSIKEESKSIYVTNFTLVLNGDINDKRLEKAWNKVVSEHDSLRTILRWRGLSQPVQIIFKHKYNPLSVIHVNPDLVHDINSYNDRIKFCETEIDLETNPVKLTLHKLSTHKSLLHLQYHHISLDGWSLGILINQLWSYYDNEHLSDEDCNLNYEHYIQHLNKVRDCKGTRDFWVNKIDVDAAISLPSINDSDMYSIKCLTHSLDKILLQSVDKFCKSNEVTIATVFYTAWSLILSKYNDSNSVCFGTTVSGRDNLLAGIEDSIGLYIQTPPLVVDNLNGSLSLKNLVKKLHNQILERDGYTEYPISEIQHVNQVRQNLFDSIVVIENYPLAKRLSALSTHVSVESYDIFETTNFDLTLEINLLDDALLKFSFNSAKFDKEIMDKVLIHFSKITGYIATQPHLTLSELNLLDDKEYKNIVFDFNDNDIVSDKPLHSVDAWNKSVENHSNEVAIRSANEVFTYNELDSLVNKIAQGLISKGITSKDLVAVKCKPSAHTIALFIAINKIGAVYVPLDISTPEERVRNIITQGVKWLIEDTELRSFVALPTVEAKIPEHDHQENDLMYTIFTSGSTGEPKGVMVEHQTVMNYVYWAIEKYHYDSKKTVYPLFTSLAFDLTATSIWCPLISGGTIEIVGKNSLESIQEVSKLAATTHIKLTPSQLNLLSQTTDFCHSNLSTFIVGGEQLETSLCRQVANSLVNPSGIFNEYGPTEATVGCMYYQYDPQADKKKLSVPIGRPINNARIYVLDRFLQPQPEGVPGELYIGGKILARGYLNKDELTSERFISNPFIPNERMYKTGDLAVIRAGGIIEYIGRNDNQVKVRGYRIELDEIASVIRSYKDCHNAAVLVKDIHGESQIVAYYVAEVHIPESDLRAYINARLPDYMTPNIFIKLDRIVLTSNGKIDQRTLPEVTPERQSKFVFNDKSEHKQKVIEVFENVLAVSDIDQNQSFFELGANSIKILRIANILNEFLPRKIKIVDFFTYTNINKLVSYIEHNTSDDSVINIKSASETVSRRAKLANRRKTLIEKASLEH